jgi:hypothetical protein
MLKHCLDYHRYRRIDGALSAVRPAGQGNVIAASPFFRHLLGIRNKRPREVEPNRPKYGKLRGNRTPRGEVRLI